MQNYIYKIIGINDYEFIKQSPNGPSRDEEYKKTDQKIYKLTTFLFLLSIIYISYLYSDILIHLRKFLFREKESEDIYNYYDLCNKEILINTKTFTPVQKPKISIISAVHNQEKYILRFLRSVQNQFFDDIEIILIDDCSKDNSVKLIEQYQKEDKRIVLLKHKKNRGTLISRNTGVAMSRGEYLIIPDIDDILSENILYNCYQQAKMKNYEILRFNIYDDTKGRLFFKSIVTNLKDRAVYQPELSTYIFYGLGYLKQIDFNLSNKFIKREAYIRALNAMDKFYLNQYMVNLEDGVMNYMLYRTAKSLYFTGQLGYLYVQNNQSITMKETENYDNKCKFIFLHWKLVFENSKNNKYEKDMANDIISRLYYILNGDYKNITEDYQFYYDILHKFLKCKFINNSVKKFSNNIKTVLDSIVK